MGQALVGRQPILDRDLDVFGYELLFRPEEENSKPINGESATSQVVNNAFVDIRLDRIVGEHRAFINVTRDFLLEHSNLTFPRDRVVLEVLEDVEIDDALIEAIKALSDSGYVIALDDFVYAPEWDPLLDCASIVKIDVQMFSEPELKEQLGYLRPHKALLLAEKVETSDEFNHFRTLGFDYFQGYFLSRPQTVRGKQAPTNRPGILSLMSRLQDPQITVGEIEELVGQDVALSYRLLRYINSAFFALPKPVESIGQAVVYVGLSQLRQWTSLLAMAGVHDKPKELMRLSLTRAKMCELLCKEAGKKDADVYFTVGLFSALGALFDQPLYEIVQELPLSETIKGALLNHTGDPGAALQCTLAYETCKWPEVVFADLDCCQPDYLTGYFPIYVVMGGHRFPRLRHR